MIKVKNGIATREPLPAALIGLAPESLLDLSWTDKALGLRGCGWWPEDDQSPPLELGQQYGDETLTLDPDRKVVVVQRAVVPAPPAELARLQQQWSDQIDAAVAEASAKPSRFTTEYLRREAQARAYVAQVNAMPKRPGIEAPLPEAPKLIAGFAHSSGLNAYEAARLTVAQADGLYDKLDQLANLRMRKYEVKRAGSVAEAFAAFGQIIAAIRAVAATIT